MLTGIIDYQAGNLQSVNNALIATGKECRLVTSPDEGEDLDALILPGQGSFGDSVRNLQSSGLWDFVGEWLAAGRPYLGICLGYQLLFEASEESPGDSGFGIFEGDVVRFPRGEGLKVPHMGWNVAEPSDRSDPFWEAIPESPHFYFVHSYFPAPTNEITGCRTRYGETTFLSGVVKDNIVATQFHPEKSQSLGLRLLQNFFARVEATAGARH